MKQKKIKYKNNVQKYRIWKGIAQKELANEIGYSVSEVRLVEKNKVTPRLMLRLKICEFFGVSHNQMFYVKENI